MSVEIKSNRVSLRNVHHFYAENIRQDSFKSPAADSDFTVEPDGNGGEKVVSSAKPGDDPLVREMWGGADDSQGVMQVYAATKEEAKRAIEDRKATIAALESKSETLAVAHVLKEQWFPGGKPVSVDYIAIDWNRRSWAVERGVMLRRYTLAGKGKVDWDYMVPVVVITLPSNPAERKMEIWRRRMRANTMKLAGHSKLTPLDYFVNACEYLTLCEGINRPAKETDFIVEYNVKRGEAQRAFSLALLNKRFPELNLLERAKKAPPGKDEPPYVARQSAFAVAALRHADLVQLKNNQPVGSTDKAAKIEGGRAGSLAAVEEYVRKSMLPSTDATISMKKLLTELAGSPCYFLQYLAKRCTTHAASLLAEVTPDVAAAIDKALSATLPKDSHYAALVRDQKEAEKKALEKSATE